jgi:hypothetical protein
MTLLDPTIMDADYCLLGFGLGLGLGLVFGLGLGLGLGFGVRHYFTRQFCGEAANIVLTALLDPTILLQFIMTIKYFYRIYPIHSKHILLFANDI